ncbi:hypothetical protein Lal_00015833 [Lupinus albus]|nr:hypothetical protein Lal_00015833 [Lupinus albus]
MNLKLVNEKEEKRRYNTLWAFFLIGTRLHGTKPQSQRHMTLSTSSPNTIQPVIPTTQSVRAKSDTTWDHCQLVQDVDGKKSIKCLYCSNFKYQSWESRLSEKVSPGRERLTWEGEILGYTEGFSPERELSPLSESGHA